MFRFIARWSNAVQDWWENTKSVLLKKVNPALDSLVPLLAKELAKLEGTPTEQAEQIIGWIKEYLRKQL